MVTYNIAELADLAINLGAHAVKIIPISDIIVADWVRLKCQYGCPSYGQFLTCPPFSPAPDMTRKIVANYQTAMLLQFLPTPPKFEWNISHGVTLKFEHELFVRGYYSAFSFIGGHCVQCVKCTLTSCVHPDIARPSMEAAGIDVFATVRKAGFEINVIPSKMQQPTYYTLVLLR